MTHSNKHYFYLSTLWRTVFIKRSNEGCSLNVVEGLGVQMVMTDRGEREGEDL